MKMEKELQEISLLAEPDNSNTYLDLISDQIRAIAMEIENMPG